MNALKEEIEFDPEVLLERVERFAAKKEAAGEHWVIALSAAEDWAAVHRLNRRMQIETIYHVLSRGNYRKELFEEGNASLV